MLGWICRALMPSDSDADSTNNQRFKTTKTSVKKNGLRTSQPRYRYPRPRIPVLAKKATGETPASLLESSDTRDPSESSDFEEAMHSVENLMEEAELSDNEGPDQVKTPIHATRSLDDLRRGASVPVDTMNQIEIAQSNLNRSQKDLVYKTRRDKARSRRGSTSSRGEGLSEPKGKGIDPKNWGALDLSDDELEAQRALYESVAHKNEYYSLPQADNAFIANESSDEASENSDNTQSSRDRHNKKRRAEYRLKKKTKKVRAKHDDAISVSAIQYNGKRDKEKKKKAYINPVEQLDRLSYVSTALKGAKKLDKGKAKKSSLPPSDPGSDSSGDDQGGDDSSSDDEDDDDDDDDDDEEDDEDEVLTSSESETESNKKSKVSRKAVYKPIMPDNYDGRPSLPAYTRFVSQATMYLEDITIPKNRQVYILSRCLDGEAWKWYARVVSKNVAKWRVSRFFEELFNECFPVNFKELQRERLDTLKQGKSDIKGYMARLDELYLVNGIRRQRDKARFFFKGLHDELKKRLRSKGLSPESSDYGRIVRKAQNFELAIKMSSAHRDNEARKSKRENNYSGQAKGKGRDRPGPSTNYGRKTNGQTESNSNQDRFRKHNDKLDANRRGWKDKNGSGRQKSNSNEKAKLKAEGKCYICKESTTHFARNCPQANSVNSKGSSSSGIQSYSAAVTASNVESLREQALEDTTQAVHTLDCNSIPLEMGSPELPPIDAEYIDGDGPDLQELEWANNWEAEAEELFNTFEDEDAHLIPEARRFFRADNESWEELDEWLAQNADTPVPPVDFVAPRRRTSRREAALARCSRDPLHCSLSPGDLYMSGLFLTPSSSAQLSPPVSGLE
ncbi:hypothetical protein D9611_013826 [Ephemerocybe angulata]|uniref:Retrotransposon gag domain-containing protein n=1 Tax=Ephemerocybe angulata TaxID=980116 RepID=A0A8H5FF62_9AGAR|nr:hypothetical protein D9611_013826 [Tulosesus angulatus]